MQPLFLIERSSPYPPRLPSVASTVQVPAGLLTVSETRMLPRIEGKGEWGLCGRTVGVLLPVPPTLIGVRENRCRGLPTQKRGSRWRRDKDEVVFSAGRWH